MSPTATNAPPIQVAIVCSGLGPMRRGYESLASELHEALADHPRLRVSLYGGPGAERFGGRAIRCVHRHGALAKALGACLRRSGYFAEQLTFTLQLFPHLIREGTDIVFSSDINTLNLLWRLRELSGARYKIVGSNGGPIGPPFTGLDFCQHVVEERYARSLEIGDPPERLALVPLGFSIKHPLALLSPDEKRRHREALGIPADRRVLLSVGALNRYHKHMDYVIREVSRLPGAERPFLVLLGEEDPETPQIRREAAQRLGAGDYLMRTVAPEEVARYYQVADAFVLGSTYEGFGRVIVEALGFGLPSLLHDYPNGRYVGGSLALFGDFRQEGALAALLPAAFAESEDAAGRLARMQAIRDRFSWEVLAPRYVEIFERCHALPRSKAWRLHDAPRQQDRDLVR